jgi:spore coat polysaccharide biosynthesis predicted glycosyltransferase SpsG
MTSCGDLRILFRAAAGPRRGYGHLVRCRSLARALGVRPLVALRGGRRVMDTAVALGCDVVSGSAARVLSRLRPDVLVVDDPIAVDARGWIRVARRIECLVVSIHDLGLGCLDADLVVDGSITNHARARNGLTLAGPKDAVLDPSLSRHSVRLQPDEDEDERDPYSVLVALGGGPRAELANDIAEAIVESNPQARVRIAGGFEGLPRDDAARIAWIGPTRMGVPVVTARRPTVTASVKRGVAPGVTRGRVTAKSVPDECAELLTNDAMRRHMARMGRKLIDGRGAFRVAAAQASGVRVSSAVRRAAPHRRR